MMTGWMRAALAVLLIAPLAGCNDTDLTTAKCSEWVKASTDDQWAAAGALAGRQGVDLSDQASQDLADSITGLCAGRPDEPVASVASALIAATR